MRLSSRDELTTFRLSSGIFPARPMRPSSRSVKSHFQDPVVGCREPSIEVTGMYRSQFFGRATNIVDNSRKS